MKNPEQIPQFLVFYRGQKLRVGFSGGADSTALLLKLLQWGWTPEQLEAVHFDHGLRGAASRADAQWCREFCARRRIPFTLVELDLSNVGSRSLEAAARDLRLEWYRRNDDNSPVVLAHHAGDRLETMLLKLARGGNCSALSSLRPCRKLWNLTILRPLLEYQKSELEDFLRQQSITDWRIDQSNLSNDFHRNYLRNDLLENWQKQHAPVISGLLQSARTLQQDAEFIEQCAADKLTELGSPRPDFTARDFWRAMHPALRIRVLRSYLAELLQDSNLQLEQSQINNFNQMLSYPDSAEKRIVELSRECRFVLRNGQLHLLRGVSADAVEPLLWQWRKQSEICWQNWRLSAELLPGAVRGKEKNCFYFDVDDFPDDLILRSRYSGERISVWGSCGARRIKHLLCGVPDKENIVLISDREENVYLLGNLRRSQLAPVTEKTLGTLQLKVDKIL